MLIGSTVCSIVRRCYLQIPSIVQSKTSLSNRKFKDRVYCTSREPFDKNINDEGKTNRQAEQSILFVRPSDLDLDYLSDDASLMVMRDNVARRKGVGDVDLVKRLHADCILDGWNDDRQMRHFVSEALRIPNRCHPSSLKLLNVEDATTEPCVVRKIGTRRAFDPQDFEPKEFHELAEKAGGLRRAGIGPFVGGRSYFLVGDLAQLEEALSKYTIQFLANKQFELISVPDLLHPQIVEACGMNISGERTQMYTLDHEHYEPTCLSGTSEMALAALFANEIVHELDLPLKCCAISKCFRAETSRIKEERGIFRVHQFTKVEMFSLSANETGTESEDILEEFVSIQTELFASLGLELRLLDMPPNELGASAYRKFDVEAWMPGRRIYGEISSSSNCTDYQSRRLNIRYGKHGRHVHTINGTACAMPRMLIALLETHQQKDGSILLPKVLRPYFRSVSDEEDVVLMRPTPGGAGLKIIRRADGSR